MFVSNMSEEKETIQLGSTLIHVLDEHVGFCFFF
jgi:hypothetical protein